jgi:hypothetical protein
MRGALHRIALVTALWALTYAPSWAIEINIDCLDRVHAEAMPAWRRAEEFAKNIEVTCQMTQTSTSAGAGSKMKSSTKKEKWTLCWDEANRSRLLERDTVDSWGKPIRVVRALNADYRFFVGHFEDQQNWTLHSGERPGDGEDFAKFSPFESTYLWYVRCSYQVYGVPLWKLFDESEFRITQVEYVDRDGTERLVRIGADYLGENGSWRRKSSAYWAEVAPSTGWLIVSAGLTVRDTNEEEKQEIVYRPGRDFFFPAKLRSQSTDPGNSFTLEEQLQFEAPKPCSRSSSEFRLTHYGISEDALTVTPSGFARWIFIGINLAVVAIIVLVIRSRRAKSAEAMA